MNNPDRPSLIRYDKSLAFELTKAFSIPVSEASVVADISMPSTSAVHNLSDHLWV